MNKKGRVMILHGRKVRVTVTLSPEVVERIQAVASLRDGNISAVVEECIAAKIGGLEMVAKARRDPLFDSVIQELLKPENIARARAIVGEDSESGVIETRERALQGKKKGKRS